MSNTLFCTSSPRMVVITRPDFYDAEAAEINALAETRHPFILHLRKPGATAGQYAGLLKKITPDFLPCVTLGDCFELAEAFPVGGVHLSSRQPSYNGGRKLRVSKSCHTTAELRDKEQYDYCFLSPIFNSISKQGYSSPFTGGEIEAATLTGIIDHRVIALGGIDENTITRLPHGAFGGAAFLGAVWQDFSVDKFLRLCRFFK